MEGGATYTLLQPHPMGCIWEYQRRTRLIVSMGVRQWENHFRRREGRLDQAGQHLTPYRAHAHELINVLNRVLNFESCPRAR